MGVPKPVLKRVDPRAELGELAYLHILGREHNTVSLASALGVSFATAARVIDGLRAKLEKEGGQLVSVKKRKKGWHYEIRQTIDWRNDPLVKGLGCVRRWNPRRMKDEDEIIYGRD